ncbi:hypothetical protein [Salipiger profundus]|jgi:hypothetical protein|uniref:hypothetical protein n=1 Tax=Salipiger profundus TaxID=1229727 RepID=UPI0003010159|nr:hypothetical protein [Salipiger profundus]SFC18083.1 hypothetical protein SAMN05444415_102305 [Salipiger profundus]
MGRKGWHTHAQGGALILARRWPARFDLSVETRLPPVRRRARLAHQVRQDLWRALQDLRGFSPCVLVEDTGQGTLVRAGGQLDAQAPRARAEAGIAELLEDPRRRARWLRWAS